MTGKQIDGYITKTINGKVRKFALNMRALCTLEDELTNNPRAKAKQKEREISTIKDLEKYIQDLEVAVKEKKGVLPTRTTEKGNLFLGLLDINNMSTWETLILIFACLNSGHPELTLDELIDEVGDMSSCAEYINAVMEAVLVSQTPSKEQEGEGASDAKKKKVGS